MTKKRGLGKSLDALLGSKNIAVEEVGSNNNPAERLSHLPLEFIEKGKYQPRREMDPDALQELANSIRAQGVIQPIVVRQLLGGRYEIVAGERRFRAAQIAGLSHIPAVIKKIPDEAAVAIALIENIQREALNPIEEAFGLQRLLTEFSMTHQAVAEAIGKSRTTVTNLLRLLTLKEDVKNLLENGDLEMGHARALLTLPETLQLKIAEEIVAKQLSVRQAEELVRRHQSPQVESIAKKINPDVVRLEQHLASQLRMKVAIHCNQKGKGKIVIHYRNLTELDDIIERF